MGRWEYTRKEKQAIGDAFTVCRYIAELRGKEKALDEAVRIERRERSCLTVARWLVVEQFAVGLHRNPRVAEVAWMARGCQVAVLAGAACRESRATKEMGDLHARLGIAYQAARLAHQNRQQRGMERDAPPAQEVERRGSAFRDSIGNAIRLHRQEKEVQG